MRFWTTKQPVPPGQELGQELLPVAAASDDSASPENADIKKERVQMVSRSNARSASSTMRSILTRKIYVNEPQALHIQDLWQQVTRAGATASGDTAQVPCSPPPSKGHLTADTATASPCVGANESSAGVNRSDKDGAVAQPPVNEASDGSASGSDDGVDACSKPARMLLLNFTAQQAEEVAQDLEPHSVAVRAETMPEGHWVRLMHTTRPEFHVPAEPDSDPLRPRGSTTASIKGRLQRKRGAKTQLGDVPQIMALRITAGELTEFEQCAIATHFMTNRIVLVLVDVQSEQDPKNAQDAQGGQGAEIAQDARSAEGVQGGQFSREAAQRAATEQAKAVLGNTWPVFEDLPALLQFCKETAPGILRMQHTLRMEIHETIKKWGSVNYVWHGAKRAPLAFLPFGVSAINFVGMSRLVGRILTATGMLKDRQARKTALGLAAQQYAKVYVLDNSADVYQFLVSSSVVLGLTSAVAAGETVGAAVSALSVADVALLGSVTVVTGVVAAISAALTRPLMVKSMAALIATLQLLWILFPEVRRSDSEHASLTEQESKFAQQLDGIAFSGDVADDEEGADGLTNQARKQEIGDSVMLTAVELLPDELAGNSGVLDGGEDAGTAADDIDAATTCAEDARKAAACGSSGAEAAGTAAGAAAGDRTEAGTAVRKRTVKGWWMERLGYKAPTNGVV